MKKTQKESNKTLSQAFPAFAKFFPVILKALRETQGPMTHQKLREACRNSLSLTPEQCAETLSSGQNRLANREYWAVSYLRMAGLIQDEMTGGGVRITADGEKFLDEHPSEIKVKDICKCPKYVARLSEVTQRNAVDAIVKDDDSEDTPDDQMVDLIKKYNAKVATRVMSFLTSDEFTNSDFEKLCVDLLLKMGYGRPELNEDSVTGKPGDGGVDGMVKNDPFGFNAVFVQAKRYGPKNNVSADQIRDFIGAMTCKSRNCGVFITTSRFTDSAINTAREAHGKNVVLIDGARLIDLMIRYELGVKKLNIYVTKEIDEDYFQGFSHIK